MVLRHNATSAASVLDRLGRARHSAIAAAGGGAVSSTRWRLLFPSGRYTAPQDGLVGVSEVEYYAPGGSTNLATGGTASAISSEAAGQPPEAFDGIKNLDGWYTRNDVIGAWLEYEFASAVTIGDFRIWFLQDFNNPGDITLQAFVNSAWGDVRAYTGLTPGTGETILFKEDGSVAP